MPLSLWYKCKWVQHLSSCWAAVVSRVSSNSVLRASSSSLKSLLSFSALFLASFSESRSSCSSDTWACSSLTCFRALFFWLTSSSLLWTNDTNEEQAGAKWAQYWDCDGMILEKRKNKTRKLTANFNENKMLRVIILVLDKFLLATDLTYMSNIPNWLCFINAN